MERDLDQCSRSSTFWYNEGNVVLRVEDTLFRIHRGVLQTHSAVFQDTFNMPQPEGEPLIEGCQVVPMHGDTVDDWDTILTFMYHPLKLNPSMPDINIDKLCSLLRVSRKYQFDELFTNCIQRLQRELPMTLDAFDKAHPAVAGREALKLGGTPLTAPAEHLIKIVNLAHELEMECILPCAYYLILSRLPLENIPAGVLSSSGNGQRIVLNLQAQEAIMRGLSVIFFDMLRSVERYTNPSSVLGAGDWEPWCGEARETALELEIEHRMMMDDDFDPTDFTIDWPNCKAAFSNIQSRALSYLSNVRGREFILAQCAPGEEFGGLLFVGLCDTCTRKEMEFRERMRHLFWNRLPTVFGIGRGRTDANGNVHIYAKSWQELTYYDAASM